MRWTKEYFKNHHRAFQYQKENVGLSISSVNSQQVICTTSPDSSNVDVLSVNVTSTLDVLVSSTSNTNLPTVITHCISDNTSDIVTKNDQNINNDFICNNSVIVSDPNVDCGSCSTDTIPEQFICDVNQVKVVDRYRKRGRPKGTQLTVIGLRKKLILTKFGDLSYEEKAFIILGWVVPNYI